MIDSFPPDEVIAQTYALVKIAADRLVVDPVLFDRFRDQLPELFRSADSTRLKNRLITLRKQKKLPPTRGPKGPSSPTANN